MKRNRRHRTFIAIDILLKKLHQALLDKSKTVEERKGAMQHAMDITRVVHRLRSQRPAWYKPRDMTATFMIEATGGSNPLKRRNRDLVTSSDETQLSGELNDSEDDETHTEFVPLMVADKVLLVDWRSN
ncbi:hypothetical protein PsorP6_010562 [Peronosclerospora sorghi]|uniref:Uncharacterized protein n=1 Tax=Peronosclerospora sorghi TaxID=230839 RepID=A0ACC0VWL1_9STRA|nr:hypothetical protein PsorP6_010562 [Peronosclerospora sorghi]